MTFQMKGWRHWQRLARRRRRLWQTDFSGNLAFSKRLSDELRKAVQPLVAHRRFSDEAGAR